MVKYLNGPIELGLGYARHIDFATYDGNAWRLHAGYDARVVKVLGAYERIHLDGNNGSVGKSNTRYYSIGVQVPIGPGTLSAQYGNRDNGATATLTAVTEVANGGAKQYGVRTSTASRSARMRTRGPRASRPSPLRRSTGRPAARLRRSALAYSTTSDPYQDQ